MIWKKNRFGYVLWFIYAIITGVSLGILLAAACMELGHPLWIGVLVCVIFMSIEAFLVWYFYHKIANQVSFGNSGSDKSKRRIFECVGVLVLLIVSVAVPVAGIFSAPEESYYFDMAKIVNNGTVPQVVHGITYLYIGLLHFVFLFFGNTIEAGYWLQIGLVFFALTMLYFAVRRMSGAVPAFLMLLFAVFSPSVRVQALVLSPEPLFLFFYGMALLMITFCLKTGRQTFGKWLFLGIFTGLLVYLDVMGVTLLLFAAGIFLVRGADVEKKLKRKAVLFLLSLLGAVFGFGGAFFADVFFSGKEPASILQATGELYMPSLPQMSMFAAIESVRFDVIILLCIMAFGIFSFWCNHWSDELAIWVLVTLGTLVLLLFQIPTQEVSGLLWCYLFMTVMAGVGISNIFKIRQVAERKVDMPKQQNNSTEGKETMGQEEKLEENREGGTVTVEFEGKTREVKLLENPLPLPKKKVHKAMDFDYEVKDDDDYDI